MKTAFDEMSDYPSKFADAIGEVALICRCWDIEAKFKDTRVPKKTRYYDELAVPAQSICALARYQNRNNLNNYNNGSYILI